MAYDIYTPRGTSLKERLRLRSRPGPDGCIDFTGYACEGYGRIRIGGRKNMTLTSRASYEAHVGPIPQGMQVLHKCDRPICINPKHLFLGTHVDNMVDRTLKGRGAVKLNEATVRDIRRDKRSQSTIAKKHGISQSMVSMIKSRTTWSHVT